MKKIGLTGNIGSGKTTASKFFMLLGIPVYNSDFRAKWLMSNDSALKQSIVDFYGVESYSDNQLNTSFISNIVFNDVNKLNTLNGLVHPFVASDFDKWCDNQSDVPYVVKEAAVLFKSDSYKLLDKIIGVVAPDKLRLERVVKRDGRLESEVLARMNKQMDQSSLIDRCDFIVTNDETSLMTTQLLLINELLLKDI
ncbi:dephospho-CoA kinase [Flavobacteriales bacterium]|nr:dephospho-CoA kinase [Flavobacteriales bacterium]